MFSALNRCGRRRSPPRTMSTQALQSIEEAHKAACDAGIAYYADPATGYKVFTSTSHEKRGFCCGNACRHCPFGHFEVKPEWRPVDSFPKTVMLSRYREGHKAKLTVGKAWNKFEDEGAERVILFWSGGKDSFLTLRALQRRNSGERITLLTTFDGKTGKIPFHNTKITDVLTQARHERLDALVVPLGGGTGPYPDAYSVTLKAALKPLRVKGLAFGDLHLQDLRSWREDSFAGAYPCEFPLFKVPYEELLERLWAETGVTLRVCAVNPDNEGLEGLSEGDVYCKAFVKGLPVGVDVMGENGEFHTHVFHETRDGDDEPSSESDSTASSTGSESSTGVIESPP